LRVGVVLTFLTYARTVTFSFVYDDFALIDLNPAMESWHSIPRMFTTQFWSFVDTPLIGSFYRPLTMLWLFLVNRLGSGAPGWFHLLLVLTHILVVIEVFVFTRMLFRDARLAALAAAIFGLHPTKIESVAWISGISDVLCAAFLFGGLIAWLRWRESSPRRGMRLVLSLVLIECALLSKEAAVVAAAMIIVYEFVARRGTPFFTRCGDTLVAALPFWTLTAAHLVVRSRISGVDSATTGYMTLPQALNTAPAALWWYIRQQFLPLQFSCYYPTLIIDHFAVGRVLLPALALLVIALIVGFAVRRSPAASMVACWFPIALGPVVAAAPALQLHDRYSYLAGYGAAVFTAWVLCRVFRGDRAFAVASALVLIALSLQTYRNTLPWDSDVSLFEHGLTVAPDNLNLNGTLAAAYFGEARYPEAIAVDQRILAHRPYVASTWVHLAECQAFLGQKQESEKSFRRVLSCRVGPDTAYAMRRLGQFAMERNDYPQAEHWFRSATIADPASAGGHRLLSSVLKELGRTAEAADELAIANRLGRASLPPPRVRQ